ncbi:MAG: hypothetical protein HC905_07955 [Bacteroidales bacterium]|nr:hypothetical protein [Bacteroidales bacterium]
MILAPDVSFSMKRPGNEFMEKWAVKHILSNSTLKYLCNGAIVYRLASPSADHYFFINDGEAKDVQFNTSYKYKQVSDAITGEKLEPGAQVHLERYSGRWLRFEK